ncbi:hypothetical protein JXA88_14045 [Candidatus Fermentibacteria bacterium]|nr:hypothetical protein [Candidatus Fermentibacteria bacterium]
MTKKEIATSPRLTVAGPRDDRHGMLFVDDTRLMQLPRSKGNRLEVRDEPLGRSAGRLSFQGQDLYGRGLRRDSDNLARRPGDIYST